ncbi:hypothetical protein H6G04_03170 [Calothrix membranacea FACHB-236]|nr:hypothetical protein [Calothrix membranacea FACHB-236]
MNWRIYQEDGTQSEIVVYGHIFKAIATDIVMKVKTPDRRLGIIYFLEVLKGLKNFLIYFQ